MTRLPAPPALVLAAGLGTRLRPLTWLRAKPAMPLAGATILERILRGLATAGITEVLVNLHHRPESIAAVAGDGSAFGLRIRYSWEPSLLGSGGGLARAFTLIEGDELLVVNGDTLTDLHVPSLVSAHRAGGSLVTMALVPRPEPGRYSGVRVNASREVTGFTSRQDPDGWHFVGVQVVRRDAFADVSADAPSESVSGQYRRLLAHPGGVRGWITRATFRDVGTPDVYLDACLAMADNECDLRGRGTCVHRTARVARTVLWDDVIVEPTAELADCIVADRVVVPRGSRYHRQTIVRADDVPHTPAGRVEGALLLTPLPERP